MICKDFYVLTIYQKATFFMCGTRYSGENLKEFNCISVIFAVRFTILTLKLYLSNELLLVGS
jgi:hypothetical protein